MKILFIGGTGTISTAISRKLLEDGHELYLINRGNRNKELEQIAETSPGKLISLVCDISDEAAAARLLDGKKFDCAADFIAFHPDQLERDWRLLRDRTAQFIFISSASAYQKPPANYRITEGTPLANPFWEYSRNKIACEEFLMSRYREDEFPVTIIRPSHTYDERSIPLGVHGKNGSWQIAQRMLDGKPVIIHGDGTSLWTMTHNSDFARAFAGLAGNIHAIGEAVTITSDETLTWNQIYHCIAHTLGVQLKAVHVSSEFLAACGDYDFAGSLTGDKSNSVVFDNSKLKSLVPGFCAVKRFDEGCRETVQNILAHPELQQLDPEFDEWCNRVIQAVVTAAGAVRNRQTLCTE
jgi:nucleoside-diphosphate-sugar epimerase